MENKINTSDLMKDVIKLNDNEIIMGKNIIDKIKYINVPKTLRNKFKKRRLNVVEWFITDDNCPYGSGLLCFNLEKNVRVIKKSGKFLWLC